METIKQKLQKYLFLDTWQRWEYKHTTGLIIGLLLFITLLDTAIMLTLRDLIGGLGYMGVFIAGLLSVSLFTAVPAVVLLVGFTELDPLGIALIAGLGSVAGDYLILRYVQKDIAYELKPLAYRLGVAQAISYLQGRKSTLVIVRALGAVVIASPLPDEVGIGLLGMSKIQKTHFMGICYALNTIGIFSIVLFARGF